MAQFNDLLAVQPRSSYTAPYDPLARTSYSDYKKLAEGAMALGLAPEDIRRLDQNWAARAGFDPARTFIRSNIPTEQQGAIGVYIQGKPPYKDAAYAIPHPWAKDTLFHEWTHKGTAPNVAAPDSHHEWAAYTLDAEQGSTPEFRADSVKVRDQFYTQGREGGEKMLKELAAKRQAAMASGIKGVGPTDIIIEAMKPDYRGTIQQPRGKAVDARRAAPTPSWDDTFEAADMARTMYPDPAAAREQMVAKGQIAKNADGSYTAR